MRIELRRKGYTALIEKVADGYTGVVQWNNGQAPFKGKTFNELQRNMDAAISGVVDKVLEGQIKI